MSLAKGMKVFGVGFSRTGTRSLSEALEMLGIRTIHWPTDRQTHYELARGNYNLTILRKYQAVTDITVAPFFAQLDKQFPGSKFILTVRDRDSWVRKMGAITLLPQGRFGRKTAFGRWDRVGPTLKTLKGWARFLNPRRFVTFWLHEAAQLRMLEFQRIAAYGALSFTDPERLGYVYDTHHRNVLEYFKDRSDDLLVLDILGGEGWERLCPFLGKPIPNVPFPHVE